MNIQPGAAMAAQNDKFYYDNKIVKWFAYATVFWGIVGMLAGILAAFQLVYPALNFGHVPPRSVG